MYLNLRNIIQSLDPSLIFSIFGLTVAITSLIISYSRFRKEKPILNYEVQSCEYSYGKLILNFIVNNSGERGTSITNIILDYPHTRAYPEDPDKETPYFMGWWKSAKEFEESFIIYVPSTSSKSITTKYNLYQPSSLRKLSVTFDIFTTTETKKIHTMAKFKDDLNLEVNS